MENLKIFTNNIDSEATKQIILLLEQEPFKTRCIKIIQFNIKISNILNLSAYNNIRRLILCV